MVATWCIELTGAVVGYSKTKEGEKPMRPKKRGPILIMLMLILFCADGLSQAQQQSEGPKIIAGPYLQHVTGNSITIMWETDQPATSMLEYGRAQWLEDKDKPAPLPHREKQDEVRTIHEVRLYPLEVQTNYFYRVTSTTDEGKEVSSNILSFQTAVREDSAFAFVVVGDNRSFPQRWGKIAARAYAERPNFVLHVGDVVTNGNKKQQWLDEYLKPAEELIGRVPIYVAIGNHEKNSHWYYKYVSYPQPENYYCFDYGNAHFAIIDSNKDLSPGSEQYEWLKKDLARTKARWRFVAHHHPPYSSAGGKYKYVDASKLGDLNVRHLVPLYEKYGVDIVWYGHVHDYERTWPIKNGRLDQKQGVIYIRTGGGGAPLVNFLRPTRSWFTAKVLRNWQYCLVNIHSGTLQMMAYDIDGRMYDYLELKK